MEVPTLARQTLLKSVAPKGVVGSSPSASAGVAMYDKAKRKALRDTNKAKAVAYLGGQCVRCGATERLEFDHVDSTTKEAPVSTLLDCTWERLLKELIKCQLLCRPCHVAKSFEQGDVPGKPAEHGSFAKYRHHGCRCKECTEANRLKAEAYRIKTGKRVGQGLGPVPSTPEHGRRGYRKGCRCDTCKEGHREAIRAWRQNKD